MLARQRKRAQLFCGGEGLFQRQGAFVEASADDHAGDADGLELADVVGLLDGSRG
jgi:hypothetical protein